MKNRLPLLILSLLGNCAAAYTLWLRPAPTVRTRSDAPANQAGAVAETRSSPTVATAPAPAPRVAATGPATALWPTLADADPTALRDRLLAAGWPRELVSAIVAARIDADFAARRTAAGLSGPNADFWISAFDRDPERQKASAKLWIEERQLLTSLLGSDYDYTPRRIAEARLRYGPLPVAKLAQIDALQSDYMEIRVDANGMGMPALEDQKATNELLDREMATDLAALLTPAEYEDYQLRASNIAQSLRGSLLGTDVTAEEFRALWQAMDAQPKADTDARQFQQLMDPAYRTALAQSITGIPAERAAELVAALNPVTSQDGAFIARFGLGADTRRALGQIRESVQTLQTNHDLSADDRAVAVQMVQQRLSTIFTPEQEAAYRESAGRWLRSIERPAPTRSTPPPGSG